MKKFKRLISLLSVLILTLALISGCGKKEKNEEQKNPWNPDNLVSAGVDDKYGACYQVFIYSFCDSDGDGIGDFNGLTSKLDYIKDLGFDSIWLLPFHQSPTYHKYDVTNYMAIDKQFGTIDDFKKLADECKKRNICLIIDLVLNHTSTSHPWFVEAKKNLGNTKNKYFNYYISY